MAGRAVFIGLDLAWGQVNPSGVAVVRDSRLVAAHGALQSDADILRFVAESLEDGCPAVVAVDAPLCVPLVEPERERRCEAELRREWARYEAAPRPALRSKLAVAGVVRGERLVALLGERLGFTETAPIPQQGTGRYVCEVYPHPAHVALFRLPRTLKYKRGMREQRLAELARYQRLLAGLEQANPPLTGLEALVTADAAALHGKQLKALEDTLDAVTCAYVALAAWTHGSAVQRVYGSTAEGHILTLAHPLCHDVLFGVNAQEPVDVAGNAIFTP